MCELLSFTVPLKEIYTDITARCWTTLQYCMLVALLKGIDHETYIAVTRRAVGLFYVIRNMEFSVSVCGAQVDYLFDCEY
jgi:hypothetical protein